MVRVPSLTSSMPDSVVVEVSSLAHPPMVRASAAALTAVARARVFMRLTLDPIQTT